MPRPKKWRKVCGLPQNSEFAPIDGKFFESEAVVMTVEEYETIRLIDNEGFTQEQCSGYMKIARTTVQQMYNNARKKLAASLVDGKLLRIEGGDYQICDGNEPHCGCGGCNRHRCGYTDEVKGDYKK